ncbi:hypothetical protein ACVWYN_000789 [Pedobacter sp. UYP24]
MKSTIVKELQLTKITELRGGVTSITNFAYDENERLSIVKRGNDMTLYTYSGNKIINIEVNEGSKTTSTEIMYTDDIPKKGISKVYQSGVLQTTLQVNISSGLNETSQINFYDNTILVRKLYLFYDNGNITEIQELNNRTITNYDYIFGEKKNVLFNANTRWAFGVENIDRISTNEILKVVTETRNIKHQKTYDYTYNEEGLPVTAVITETDPPLAIETKTFVTYTYEKL